MNEEYTKEILLSRLESYKAFHSSSILHKKIRRPNFPEDISENIVKNFLDFETTWKKETGDLYSEKIGKIEIKCFSSDGPISFGPKEEWEILYVLDAKNFKNNIFKIHQVDLSSKQFRNIQVSKSQTFGDQILQSRRPRICWQSLYAKIKNHVTSTKIFLASD
jgi:hypothetical protein